MATIAHSGPRSDKRRRIAEAGFLETGVETMLVSEGIRASQGHLAPGRWVSDGSGEIICDADLLKRVPFEKLLVRVAEM